MLTHCGADKAAAMTYGKRINPNMYFQCWGRTIWLVKSWLLFKLTTKQNTVSPSIRNGLGRRFKGGGLRVGTAHQSGDSWRQFSIIDGPTLTKTNRLTAGDAANVDRPHVGDHLAERRRRRLDAHMEAGVNVLGLTRASRRTNPNLHATANIAQMLDRPAPAAALCSSEAARVQYSVALER